MDAVAKLNLMKPTDKIEQLGCAIVVGEVEVKRHSNVTGKEYSFSIYGLGITVVEDDMLTARIKLFALLEETKNLFNSDKIRPIDPRMKYLINLAYDVSKIEPNTFLFMLGLVELTD